MTRVRSRTENEGYSGGTSTLQVLYRAKVAENTTTVTPRPGGPPALRVTTDTITPHFARRKRRGELVMNDYSSLLREELVLSSSLGSDYQNWEKKNPPGMYTHEINTSNAPDRGYWEGWVNPDHPVFGGMDLSGVSNAKRLALQKAYAKVTESEAMGLVTLAEIRKTAVSISKLGWSLLSFRRKADRLARRRNSKLITIKRYSSELSSLWLEYRYSFRQLYFDVMSFYNAGLEYGGKQRLRFTATEVVNNTSSSNKTYAPSTRSIMYWEKTGQVTHHVTAGVYVAPRPVKGLNEVLGGTRFLSSAWELTKFSFLIDWFLSTGHIMSSLDTLVSTNIRGSWVTVRSSHYEQIYHTHLPYYLDTSNNTYTRTPLGQNVVGLRLTGTTREANPPYSSFPAIKVRFDWQKCLDVLALARGILPPLITKLRR